MGTLFVAGRSMNGGKKLYINKQRKEREKTLKLRITSEKYNV
jgi:hypothetical protein